MNKRKQQLAERKQDKAWKRLENTINKYCLPDAQDLYEGLYECLLADIAANKGVKVMGHQKDTGILFHIYERLNCNDIGYFKLNDLISHEDDDDYLKLLYKEFLTVTQKIKKMIDAKG